MTPGRRQLHFADLQSAARDAQHLLAAGHRTLGQWTLAQICHHLSATIGYSIDGYPGAGFPPVIQATLGRVIRSYMFRTGRIIEGVPLPANYQPSPSLDVAKEVGDFCAAVDRFCAFTGELRKHPMIGQMTRDDWDRFHRIHCEHHLSFAVANE